MSLTRELVLSGLRDTTNQVSNSQPEASIQRKVGSDNKEQGDREIFIAIKNLYDTLSADMLTSKEISEAIAIHFINNKFRIAISVHQFTNYYHKLSLALPNHCLKLKPLNTLKVWRSARGVQII
jgi:hypothetical protein